MTTPTDCPSLRLAGFQVRTTFAAAGADIGPLWQRAGAILKEGQPAFSAYFDYGTDGAYSVLVGRTFGPDEVLPEGVTVLDVPAQSCLIEQVEATPAAIGAWWGALWQRWPDGGPRRFAVDLERWTGMGPEHRVEVRIGVHPERLGQ